MFNLKPQMIHLILSLRPWHQSEVALPHHHLDHWQALRHSKTIKIINMPNWTWDYWNPELERILNRNDFQLRLIIFVEIHFGLGGLACAIADMQWLSGNDSLARKWYTLLKCLDRDRNKTGATKMVKRTCSGAQCSTHPKTRLIFLTRKQPVY